MPTILANANATMIADRAANTRTLLSWEPRHPTNAQPKQGNLLTNTRATLGTLVVVGLNPSTATSVCGDGGVLSAVEANPTAAGERTEAAHAAALAQGLEPGAIMLDATLNRINRAAAEMGYSRVVMLNAYPYRATTPEGLWEWEERSGFNMRDYIAELDKVLEEIKPAAIVAAWGSSMPQRLDARAAHGWRMALLKLALKRHAPLMCWGLLGNGAPAHPLRLSAERLRLLDSFGE